MENESTHAEIAKSLWINSAVISRHLDNSLGAIHGIGLAEYMVLLNLMNAPNQTLRRIDIADCKCCGVTISFIKREIDCVISIAG